VNKRYNDFNTYLRSVYGCRVQKITVDAGFTCPNRDGTLSTEGCVYCNPKGSGTGAHKKGLSVTRQLLAGKKALYKRYKAKKFMAYFQAFTNTYAPLDILRNVYGEALSVDDIIGLSIGTRPDCVDNDILNLLEGYVRGGKTVWIEYGLQSACDSTLSLINRGHDVTSFSDAVTATKNRGINICAHVILGLPGEQRHHMLETADLLANMGVDGVKIHLLYVVKGTKLEEMYREKQFQCLEQEEYAALVCDVLEHLPKEMVIQRLTGDPHPEELVAPMWSLKKNETLRLINDILETRNSYQGKRVSYSPSNPSQDLA
jgi:uncharacterized protein